ncbi:Pimeloyl-ACP methyl ester carboxylesterase [Chitinophaga costaii]|uniref:Pimeloyl-ACP methyl ester carboxylesterase n=2 Tax=Chitinophaga costaii TaxID=1335309 RepID=A0A1C4F2J8_9BACT|nr:Pimeloyl-ACP methyl ester carboxylesterase [Chitinophaga costaii]
MPKADQSGLAPVNDIQLYYAIFNKNGKDPVLLLHGGLSSSDIWGFEVPKLLKTHCVIIVDSRGHGRSTMSDQPMSYSLMSADILGLMDFLHLKTASIVGWSDGGIIGLDLAIHHPDRIYKLFTFGANYDTTGYKPVPSDTSTATLFRSRVAANYRRLSPTPDSLVKLKKALGSLYSREPMFTAAELKTIKAPTVIAYGAYEQFITPEHFKALAALIPNARLVMLPNVSHAGPLQDPDRFHEAVVSLLNAQK